MAADSFKNNKGISMKIAFYSNYLNHHQTLVSDELYKLTNRNYYFIETTPIPEFRREIGYKDYRTKPYCIQAWKSEENLEKARKICYDADVVLFIPSTSHYGVSAAKKGKICFEVGERWLKRGFINFLSPRLLKSIWQYYKQFRNRDVFRLCNSAYAASDLYKMQTYKNKCYKWGYFTKVDDCFDIETSRNNNTSSNVTIRIMWCARFLKIKHPELPVKMAASLKEKGYTLQLDMYGSGPEEEATRTLIKELSVEDVVKMHGSMPNENILQAMREHDIFLFTSDKHEGWGAVSNEAMSNGCVLVGSNKIGSIPFLVKDGENGCIFKSEDVCSLIDRVEWLINNPAERKRLSINGYYTMKETWSPANAAKSLLQLIDDIKNGKDTSIKEGPCSKALPI